MVATIPELKTASSSMPDWRLVSDLPGGYVGKRGITRIPVQGIKNIHLQFERREDAELSATIATKSSAKYLAIVKVSFSSPYHTSMRVSMALAFPNMRIHPGAREKLRTGMYISAKVDSHSISQWKERGRLNRYLVTSTYYLRGFLVDNCFLHQCSSQEQSSVEENCQDFDARDDSGLGLTAQPEILRRHVQRHN